MICAALAACGGDTTSTTSVTDSTTLNGSPMGHTATDNTGAGIEGGSINDGIDPQGVGTNTGTNSGANNGTTGSNSEATTGRPGATGSSADATRGRNDNGVRITKEDSVSNRSGLAPVK